MNFFCMTKDNLSCCVSFKQKRLRMKMGQVSQYFKVIAWSFSLLGACTVNKAHTHAHAQQLTANEAKEIQPILNAITLVPQTAEQINSIENWTVQPNVDIGTCICDLTANYCNVGCLCDTDCSNEQKALFTTIMPDGPRPKQLMYCTNADVVDVNLRGEITQNLGNNLFCISIDNNPHMQQYYDNPTTLAASEIQTALTDASNYTFAQVSTLQIPGSDASYLEGDKVGAAILGSDGGYQLYNGGIYPFPVADTAGLCNDGGAMYFLLSDLTLCSRQVTAATCTSGSVLSASRITANVFLSSLRSTIPPTILSSSLYVPLVITNFQGTPPEPFMASNTTCDNILQSISYNLTYDSSGTITGATASVSVGSSAIGAFVTQSYELNWPWNGTPNGTVYDRSGNPGYITGLPLVAGNLVTVNGINAIAQNTGGLAVLPVDSNGQCTTSGTGSIVNFGEDQLFTCYQNLTWQQLQSVCASGFSSFLNVSELYIGAWGNSTYLDPSQWIAMTVPATSLAGTLNTGLQRCSNLVTSMTLQIVYAKFGAIDNPQKSVMAAVLTYDTETLTALSTSVDAAQLYMLSASVQFIEYGALSIDQFVPPAPPLLPSSSSDLLYPLFIPNGASKTTMQATYVLTLVSAALMVIMQ